MSPLIFKRRFPFMSERLWRNWIAHRSSEPRVGGSNPFRRVFEVFEGFNDSSLKPFFIGVSAIF